MKCKYCGTTNEDNRKYCLNCGMPLEYGKMLNCYSCGVSVKPKYKYCPECGVDLKLKRRCPDCNILINYDDKFCKNCGRKLDKINTNEEEMEEKEDTTGTEGKKRV
ncbi:MAG: zinc-ribbon domain-containing protein [Candidatus Mcinerneyibacterium aminivorans]|uniref:Zinc-ribbon domain-containing protein n=1 Tax=Candidatus Mcinerneyibacterium aminivorans TaxID=2703815 RepID=A0A5D0MFE7_9BACT|nr:MAG: zinc-ribbon domain-containing protein [Candidatus Mcinerneyibacterium aminivorans]